MVRRDVRVGRRSSPAKRVYGHKPVSRVQIPLSPPPCLNHWWFQRQATLCRCNIHLYYNAPCHFWWSGAFRCAVYALTFGRNSNGITLYYHLTSCNVKIFWLSQGMSRCTCKNGSIPTISGCYSTANPAILRQAWNMLFLEYTESHWRQAEILGIHLSVSFGLRTEICLAIACGDCPVRSPVAIPPVRTASPEKAADESLSTCNAFSAVYRKYLMERKPAEFSIREYDTVVRRFTAICC